MASRVEKAMQKLQAAAMASASKRDAKAADVTVSIARGRCIVDYLDKDREPVRFEYVPPIDEVAAEEAEAASKIRRVKHG